MGDVKKGCVHQDLGGGFIAALSYKTAGKSMKQAMFGGINSINNLHSSPPKTHSVLGVADDEE
jgi:hypothetical protein